jgi:hypothetical protein
VNIGVDIDGVLFPWADVVNEVVMERFGVPDPGPHVHWSHLRDVITPDQWAWVWGPEGLDAVFSRVERTYEGTVEAINAILGSTENKVHFVTHRDPRRTALQTSAFLTLHFGGHPWAGVHILEPSVRKSRLMRWDMFVDDKPETVFDFLENTSATVFAPQRPWNLMELNLGLSAGTGFVHYIDPQEIVEWVGAHS